MGAANENYPAVQDAASEVKRLLERSVCAYAHCAAHAHCQLSVPYGLAGLTRPPIPRCADTPKCVNALTSSSLLNVIRRLEVWHFLRVRVHIASGYPGGKKRAGFLSTATKHRYMCEVRVTARNIRTHTQKCHTSMRLPDVYLT